MRYLKLLIPILLIALLFTACNSDTESSSLTSFEENSELSSGIISENVSDENFSEMAFDYFKLQSLNKWASRSSC